MVDALETGSQPEVNDTKTYDNGKKVVPSYLLNPVLVTKANWKPVLVDGGYYKADQLGSKTGRPRVRRTARGPIAPASAREQHFLAVMPRQAARATMRAIERSGYGQQ